MFLDDCRVEDVKERDEKRLGKSSSEMGTWKLSCASQITIANPAVTSLDTA
jgi:hypothetical protein